MRNLLNSLILVVVFSCIAQGIAFEDLDIDIYGETNYSKQSSESLTTSMNLEFRHKIYEPSHNKWGLYLKGIINPDYDHFQNEIKVNTFTTLGIDF